MKKTAQERMTQRQMPEGLTRFLLNSVSMGDVDKAELWYPFCIFCMIQGYRQLYWCCMTLQGRSALENTLVVCSPFQCCSFTRLFSPDVCFVKS